jgi:hypothetical protein
LRAGWKTPSLTILLLCLVLGHAPKASADAAILLEEPYSYDGALAGTGHVAVYLTRICAATPVRLRRCRPGEEGVVISRYTRIGGYDWIAIPLIPYLYAVETPREVPLYADGKLVAFLRNQYRHAHLADVAPDAPDGATPNGDWVQLVGSAYDRTDYGFEIETTVEQDDALIAALNSEPNRATYNFVSRNCADFVRQILNFYYPKAVSRGSLPDLWVNTPKHAAKSLTLFGRHHPDLESAHFVIPQVPGTMKRSKPVRGVLESFFRAKKYVLVLAVFHPFVAAGVASANLVDRFNPARNTVVFEANGGFEKPPTELERRASWKDLERLTAAGTHSDFANNLEVWRQFEKSAHPHLSADGKPSLEATFGNESVTLVVTRSDLPGGGAPAEIERGLLISRLRQTLSRSRAPRTSSSELHRDWELLKEIDAAKSAGASRNPALRNPLPPAQSSAGSSD